MSASERYNRHWDTDSVEKLSSPVICLCKNETISFHRTKIFEDLKNNSTVA